MPDPTPPVIDEAAWLGADHPIVQRTRRHEREALGEHATVHRIIGPPGTGKTTYLSRQATVAAGKYGTGGVLLASLTKAAALEIAGRDTPIDRNMVGTLHAHAFRALDRPALAETPEGLREWNEHAIAEGWAPRLLMTITGGSGSLDLGPQDEPAGGTGEGDRLRSRLATLRARTVDPALYDPDLAELAERWAAWKDAGHRMDFTDLIEQSIARELGAPGDPAVIMLDEAQDMSRLEMRLARQWARGCEQLVTVSDPNQALYTWRGADPDSLFEGDAATERVLEQSYRVPRAVHAYAVDWISKMPGYRHFAYQPRDEDGSVQRRTEADLTWVRPDGLLDLIAADQQAGRSVMVLASCGYMLAPLVNLLKAHGVPFSNPWRPTHGGWNPMRGAERLASFLRPDAGTWGEEARAWDHGDLRRWIDPLQAKGVLARGAKTWLESKNLVDRFGESAESQVADVVRVLGLFADESIAERAFDLDVEWWLASHLASRRAPSEFPVEVWRRQGGRALRDPPTVHVGTIHSFKGSEADSCYLWPDLSHAAYVTGWANPADRAGAYRTFYVAMTRARERLTVLPASGNEYVPLPHPDTVGSPT